MNKEFAVVISPHIDDAAISIGEILRGYDKVLVLNVFNKSIETVTGVSKKDVNNHRILEDKKIAQQYGFEFKYANLPDTSLRGIDWNNHNLPIDQELLTQVQEWIKSELDQVEADFRIFIPASYGLHPDHCLATLTFSTGPLLYYLKWIPFFVYCDQPYFLNRKIIKDKHEGHSALEESGTLIAVPFSVVEKRIMLSAYKSQLSPERVKLLAGKNKAEYYWITSHKFFKFFTKNLGGK